MHNADCICHTINLFATSDNKSFEWDAYLDMELSVDMIESKYANRFQKSQSAHSTGTAGAKAPSLDAVQAAVGRFNVKLGAP